MNGEQLWRNSSLDDLLEAGQEAYGEGDRDEAHNLWRAAAVANPYDERVWVSLLEVLTYEEDREVCLENIIAINPLNPDARRELRALKRDRRLRAEAATGDVVVAPAPTKRAAKVKSSPKTRARPKRERQQRQQGILIRAILTGILIGLFAVVLGIIASIVVYGGVLNLAAF